MDEVALIKGANCGLPAGVSGIQVVVAWDETEAGVDVDAAALLLDASGRVQSDDDFVFFNQPASPDGSVRLHGRSSSETQAHERIGIDLERLDPAVRTVAVTASLAEGSFGALDGLNVRVLDALGTPLARHDISYATTETAFVFCEVYRRGEEWKVRAVGQGWDTGLAGLATDFGVAVEEETADASADAAPEATDDSAASPAPTTDPGIGGSGVPDDEVVDVIEQPTGSAEQAVVVATPDVAGDAPGDTAATVSAPRRQAGVRTSKRSTTRVAPPRLRLAGAETWQPARLFSISGVGSTEEQERRATSALLATMMGVPAFGRALTARFGAPAGTVETYLEVPFALGDTTVIPDGVMRVSRGAKLWTGLLEVKTGSGQLGRDQVEHYLDVARLEGYDTLVTLSNEIAPHPGEHPVVVDKRKLKRTTLTHLSWAEVLHEAKFTLHHRGVGDALQAWLLHELVRYLEHPRSGAGAFDDMGPSWVPVREAIHAGTLRASDRKVPAVADAWTRLVRQMCLRLGSDLGVTVSHALPRKLATDSVARIQAIVSRLAADGVLEAVLKVPLAAGPLTVVADLRTSQVRVSVAVDAPQEGSGQRRLGWLLRQLRDAPDALLVETVFAGRVESACEQLGDVRQNPAALLPARGAEITSFRLTLTSPMGTKRSGVRGAFVPSVTSGVEAFYSTVVQPLKAWQPAAPQLPEEVRADALAEQAVEDGGDEPAG